MAKRRRTLPRHVPQPLTPELARWKEVIREHARSFGLDFFDVVFELLDYDEVNEVASYGGFPTRYPHWRWGMAYEELSRGYSYGLQKIYELVINNDPTYAYLMRSNSLLDQKLVMAHVYGHADFFKHNHWFSETNRKMLDEMANHAIRVRRYIDKVGLEEVESFIDACLSLENLIDFHSLFIERHRDRDESPLEEGAAEEEETPVPRKLESKAYMDRFVNPPEFLEAQRKALEEEVERQKQFPAEPEKDILWFLLEHAPLDRWQRDILSIIREEAYYFAPQKMTKIMNEGWACVAPGTPVFTADGLRSMDRVVGDEVGVVSDGEEPRAVYDRNVVPDQETVTVRTRRGLRLTGSTNHRVLLADGETWRRLDELEEGDRLKVAGGGGLWPEDEVTIAWEPADRVTLHDVAEEAGVSVWTVLRRKKGRNVRAAEAVDAALEAWRDPANQAVPQSVSKRKAIRVPATVDPRLARFLGYLVGDGHVSRVKRHVGLTTADEGQAEAFLELVRELFGLEPHRYRQGSRWRVLVHAEHLSDLLVDGLGLTEGPSASEKAVPPAILRSPAPVVRAFLRAYFDADGHAGPQGVILSTASDALAEQSQLLLLNLGILSRRRRQSDGCWHVHVTGRSAARFAEEVGFGLERKREALRAYAEDREWFKRERWDDEVVELERGRGDVYDISVRETHRYAAAGLVNHNSYWHSTIMTRKVLQDDEIIDYADQHAGTMGSRPGVLNPYKVGLELFRDIEDRWNKGKFGREWDDCDDMEARRNWDKQLGLGREKIFEVRKIYNDVLFIDEFLTKEFCEEQKLFTYEYHEQSGQYVIADREFETVKEKLLFDLTNAGEPHIEVVDGNWENRGELYLVHRHEGVDLKMAHAKDTLENLFELWTRPVHLETVVDRRRKLLSHDGETIREKTIEEDEGDEA